MSKESPKVAVLAEPRLSRRAVPKIIALFYWTLMVPFVCLVCHFGDPLCWIGIGLYATLFYAAYKQNDYYRNRISSFALAAVALLGPAAVIVLSLKAEWAVSLL